MIQTIITVVVTSITSAITGYFLNALRHYRKKEKSQTQALLTLLQSNLTNTYFAYEKIGQIPDYVYKNWLNELEAYEGLGGDDYVHTLAKKIQHFEIIRTDILTKSIDI